MKIMTIDITKETTGKPVLNIYILLIKIEIQISPVFKY